MTLVEAVFSFNLVQLAATFASGAGLYVLCQRYRNIFNLVGYFLSLGIFFSFLFNVGEVYPYSDYYKRAFFFFGDDVTTIIILFFCYAVLSGNTLLAILLAASIFLSGGKVSLILLLIMICMMYLANRKNDILFKKNFFTYIVIGLSMYFIMLFASIITEDSGFSGVVRDISRSISEVVKTNDDGKSSIGKKSSINEKSSVDRLSRGAGACKTLSRCFDTQIKAPVLQRYHSSLAGLWMTLEGGYRGSRYPSSSDDFANLMIQENPWGINDRYGLDFSDWKMMGVPQNPYLHFGSGYGPWFLGALVIAFFFIGLVAVFNLLGGENGAAIVFSIFFIVIVTFNQTQSWLTSGSPILIALGFCAYHILGSWQLIQYKSYNLFRPLGGHPT